MSKEKTIEELRAECTHHYVINVSQEGPNGTRGMGFRVGSTEEMPPENIRTMVHARAASLGWPQDLKLKIIVVECPSAEVSQMVYDTIPGERDSDEDHLKFLKKWKEVASEGEEVVSMRFHDRGPKH